MRFAWEIAAVGFGMALVAALQARAGRLSLGHGAAWTLAGAALLIAGILLGLFCGARAPFTTGGAIVAGLALALALGFGLAHAVALSRLNERVKRLAQEVALLQATAPSRPGASGVPTEAGASQDAAQRKD
jgi:hypothetical protein